MMIMVRIIVYYESSNDDDGDNCDSNIYNRNNSDDDDTLKVSCHPFLMFGFVFTIKQRLSSNVFFFSHHLEFHANFSKN